MIGIFLTALDPDPNPRIRNSELRIWIKEANYYGSTESGTLFIGSPFPRHQKSTYM
jgi:hypothetical protein